MSVNTVCDEPSGLALTPEQGGILCEAVTAELDAAIVDQEQAKRILLLGMLASGHVLLEGPPGVGKTTLAIAFAKIAGLSLERIQGSPDLTARDVEGQMVYNPTTGLFEPQPGSAVRANCVFVDELNRIPPKIQGTLLAPMAEGIVTLNGVTYRAPDPYMVIATQNGAEHQGTQIGTQPLPEAVVDRFMLRARMHHLDVEGLFALLNKHDKRIGDISVERALDLDTVVRLRKLTANVFVDDELKRIITQVIHATNEPGDYGLVSLKEHIVRPVGERGLLGLCDAAKAEAVMNGRHYVEPSDVRAVVPVVLEHRIGVRRVDQLPPEEIIQSITNAVMPRKK